MSGPNICWLDFPQKRRRNRQPPCFTEPKNPVVVPFRYLAAKTKIADRMRGDAQHSSEDGIAAQGIDHRVNSVKRLNSNIAHALTKSHNVIGVKGMNDESRKSSARPTISRMPRPSGETLVDDVAFRLKVSRIALEKSQTDIAKALDILPHRWSQWENGRTLPAIPIMAKYADRYGVSLDWIYRGRPETMASGLADKIIHIADKLLATDTGRRRA